VTNCPSTVQDSTGYGDSIDLQPGFYRAVFVGSTSLGYKQEGTSEISIELQTSTGAFITDFSKSVSGDGTSERSFQYIWMPEAGRLESWSRVSTSCGAATLQGVLAFERVGDPY
jgi:hypothetical protein